MVTGVGKDKWFQAFMLLESAPVCPYGANRLGANSLLDLVVFGRAAGAIKDHIGTAELAEQQRKTLRVLLNVINVYKTPRRAMKTSGVEMRQVMQEDFGVFREAKSMEEGLKKLKSIKESRNIRLEDKSSVFNTARQKYLSLRIW